MNDDDGNDDQMMMVSDDDDRVTESTQSLSQLPRVGYKKLTEFLVNRQTITAARGPENCYHRVRELYGQLADNFLSSIYSIKSTENLSALELYNYPVNKKCTMVIGLGREQKAIFQGLQKSLGFPTLRVLNEESIFAKHVCFQAHYATHGMSMQCAELHLAKLGYFVPNVKKIFKSFRAKCSPGCHKTQSAKFRTSRPVSYTHLTLLTICSV